MPLRLLRVLLLGLLSCNSARPSSKTEWIPTAAPDLGSVVAKVGDVPIFAKQVLAQAKHTGSTPRQALAVLIDDHAAAEAVRRSRGFSLSDDDLDVQSAFVQRLLERELEPALDQASIPDSKLRPLYERARDSFVRPRLVEIGLLATYIDETMKAEVRQSRAETAKQLATFLAQHPAASLEEFAAVASAPRWSEQGVVYQRRFQGPDKPLSKTVGSAVAKLRRPGDTTSLLGDETGYFIARYIDEKAAQNTTFEQARPTLVAAYLEHWRQEEFLSFSAKLLQKHKIQVHFDRITANEEWR